jgi:hypothetical protein
MRRRARIKLKKFRNKHIRVVYTTEKRAIKYYTDSSCTLLAVNKADIIIKFEGGKSGITLTYDRIKSLWVEFNL